MENDEITMLYQIIGQGTQHLSELSKGTTIQVLGPLGNTFDIVETTEPAIIVGGGAGIASLMLLASALRKRRIQTIALVGSQNSSRLLSVDDLRAISVVVHIATDDGSIGHHGFVTDMLTNMLSNDDLHHLAAVSKISTEHELPTQVAMENRMGCAMGVCLGCVCPVRINENLIDYQRVCTEGPVFNAEEIAWEIS